MILRRPTIKLRVERWDHVAMYAIAGIVLVISLFASTLVMSDILPRRYAAAVAAVGLVGKVLWRQPHHVVAEAPGQFMADMRDAAHVLTLAGIVAFVGDLSIDKLLAL